MLLQGCTEVCRLVVTNLRRKSAHAFTFSGNFELKFRACANSRRKICDNQPANLCMRRFSTEVCRLVVTNLRREFAHARNFQFKIPTKSVRKRGFSSQICVTLNCRSVVIEKGRQFHACALNPIDFEWQ